MANNFNPGFDREKATFIALANRGEGLTPINYLYAKEASFESILSPVITGGTAELYTIYTTGINIWTLPLADGTDGQVLSTNGNGILSFIDAGGGKAPDDATYILQQPSSDLPNAQALNQLNNGLMKNNDGVIQIAVPGEDYLSATLPSGQLFIGNSSNIATAQQTITIDNLPNLGTTSINVPNPLDPTHPIVISGGKIWHGTDSNRPEESNALLVVEGDIALINFRFLSANFILGKGNTVLQTLMPGSQFLSNLTSGSWMQTSGAGTGAIVAATITQNQLLMGGFNNVPEARQTIDITNLPSLTDGRVWQGDAANRPVEVQLNFAPTNATYVLNTSNGNLPNAQILNNLGSGILKIGTFANGRISIASGGKNLITDDYVRPIDLDEEITARIEADTVIEGTIAALEAEVEAEIAALAAVEGIHILATILGWAGLLATGKNYGEYIRGLLLNVKNTWYSTDLNDEGHNAVGDFEFRWPSGYSSDDRGHGTLWFDSKGRKGSLPKFTQSEPGLRIFSWDSGGDHIGYDDPIAPLHIGIFGYQNKYHTWPIPNPTASYKGFIFRSEFNNNDSNDNDYRYPINFGLYDVKRTISSSQYHHWGWDHIYPIFEYNYTDFTFYKQLVLKEYTNFEKEADFQKNVRFLGTGAVKIPVGNSAERPNQEVGMIRFNTSL